MEKKERMCLSSGSLKGMCFFSCSLECVSPGVCVFQEYLEGEWILVGAREAYVAVVSWRELFQKNRTFIVYFSLL
jgi:hypothetical protein